LIVLGIGLIAFGIYKLNNAEKPKLTGSSKFGGEYRSFYVVKSHDLSSKKKISIPAAKGEDFSCTNSDDFKATCTSKHTYLYINNYIGTSYSESAERSLSSYKKNETYNQVEEIKCIPDAKCYKLVGTPDDHDIYEELIIYMQGGNDTEYYTIKYAFFDVHAEEYIDDIYKNIKVTNDAEYKIGKMEDDKLTIRFKADTNVETCGYADLVLDGKKYMEIEDRNNNVDRTTVKTATSGNIYVSFTVNYESYDGYEYYRFLTNDEYDHYSISFTPDNDHEAINFEKIMIDDKIIYRHKQRNYYAIYVKKDLMVSVEFSNINDVNLLSDFLNITGEYVGYSKE
jgi:hypothetical protein